MEKMMKNIAEISIAGKNVTGDVSAFLSQISYTDKIEAESDDVSLSFEDTKGVWQSAWYPQQGDSLTVKIGQQGNLLDCGLFEIDEIELSLAPDVLQIKGIAASISQSLRTKNNKAFEKQSLRSIANFFAKKHKLKITGNTGKLQKIEIERKTQENQTDLAFLADLAKEYGLIFSVRGDQLIFIDREDLEKAESILKLDRTQLSSANFKDKTSQIFSSSVITKRNVKENTVQHWKIVKSDTPGVKDTLVTSGRAENSQQAEAKSNAKLDEKNRNKITGSISVPGNPLLVAGANIDLEGIGNFSGKWHIVSSSHTVSADGGYKTSIEIRKL